MASQITDDHLQAAPIKHQCCSWEVWDKNDLGTAHRLYVSRRSTEGECASRRFRSPASARPESKPLARYWAGRWGFLLCRVLPVVTLVSNILLQEASVPALLAAPWEKLLGVLLTPSAATTGGLGKPALCCRAACQCRTSMQWKLTGQKISSVSPCSTI